MIGTYRPPPRWIQAVHSERLDLVETKMALTLVWSDAVVDVGKRRMMSRKDERYGTR